MLLQIATSDAQLPLEKNFDENLKLSDFKEKLFLITGIEPNDMSLSCNGKGLKDNVTLKELGLTRGARIQVSDLSGNISKLTEDLESVEKYQISNEAYSKREDTFAKFRESKGIKGPAEKNVSDYPEVVVGKRCIIDGGHRGEICFFGNIENKPGVFVGVRLDDPFGKNDGTVSGKRYFECLKNCGIFLRPDKIKVGDFPPLSDDEEL